MHVSRKGRTSLPFAVRGFMLVVAFHTTAEAFACEALCRRQGIEGRLIAVPRSITAGCGYAWRAEEEAKEAFESMAAQGLMEYEGLYVLPDRR